MNEVYLHMIWQNRLVFLFCLQYTSFLHVPDEGCCSIFFSVGIQRHKFLSICPTLPNLTIRHLLQTEQWWINWHWSKNQMAISFLNLNCFLYQVFIFFLFSTFFKSNKNTELILILD